MTGGGRVGKNTRGTIKLGPDMRRHVLKEYEFQGKATSWKRKNEVEIANPS